MKSVFSKISLVLLLSTAVFAVANATADKGKKGKKHKCNTECKAGAHMYKCGEKGHKCTDGCKKMSKTGTM